MSCDSRTFVFVRHPYWGTACPYSVAHFEEALSNLASVRTVFAQKALLSVKTFSSLAVAAPGTPSTRHWSRDDLPSPDFDVDRGGGA
ncbi:hypothetical protein CSOJ01_08305 [Colletotrichum sojae]|uniref:Uncharacterized protein n=1 Tax=Colletotrichum sojae TaxID=2175907 RepID=A0A8H6J696_9PEZI|nr:hypothetical protein CSOJ01_08305 [Colletotrichum sojae]